MASDTIPTKRTNEIVIRTKYISQHRDVPRLVRPRRVWLRRRDGDVLSRRWRGVVDVLIEGCCITRVRFDTPCIYSADDHARIFVTHRTPCIESADDRAHRFLIHRTPCTESADDRARRLMPHRTPCIFCAHDRARTLMTHRTPCNTGAHDRARRLMPHRTPCTCSAYDRADKRCTPCSSSEASPRARTAPLCKGLSSASCPSCSTPLSMYPCSLHRRHSERLS